MQKISRFIPVCLEGSKTKLECALTANFSDFFWNKTENLGGKNPSSLIYVQKKKSQIKVKELLSSWNQTPLGMQITYCNLLSAQPLVSSVDEILSPRQQLSRGTQTNEKIFIVLAFQMARKEEEALTDHCPWN